MSLSPQRAEGMDAGGQSNVHYIHSLFCVSDTFVRSSVHALTSLFMYFIPVSIPAQKIPWDQGLELAIHMIGAH